MAKISFVKNRDPITVPDGTNLRLGLIENGVPVASSCGGVAVCSKCWVKVLEGQENLTPPNADEQHLKSQGSFGMLQRISCQVEVLGDITVDAPYW